MLFCPKSQILTTSALCKTLDMQSFVCIGREYLEVVEHSCNVESLQMGEFVVQVTFSKGFSTELAAEHENFAAMHGGERLL